jgi:hypothetical protein
MEIFASAVITVASDFTDAACAGEHAVSIKINSSNETTLTSPLFFISQLFPLNSIIINRNIG